MPSLLTQVLIEVLSEVCSLVLKGIENNLLFFSSQDVFLMIRRHKTTIFTDAKESTTVYELKRIVEGILKRPPEDQRLYKVSKENSQCVLQLVP